jgi:putative oxidoreductase
VATAGQLSFTLIFFSSISKMLPELGNTVVLRSFNFPANVPNTSRLPGGRFWFIYDCLSLSSGESKVVSNDMMLLEPFLGYVPYLALLIRVVIGGTLMAHGYPKLKSSEQSANWMKSMGIPGATAVLAGVLEFFGGLFLVLGFIVPIVGAMFAIQFVSITVMKKRKMKASYVASGKPSYEVDILYLLFSIILIILGAGALSIDGLIGL